MNLDVIDLTPRVGSEVRIDRAALLGGGHAGRLRDLLVARGVLVVRDLHLSDDEQRGFARAMGDLRLGSFKKEGEEGLQKVTLDRKVNPEYARFFFGSQLWHMDGTYDEIPPFATILTPRVLSEAGGETEFASTYAAYEDWSDSDKPWLETLRVVHTMQAALFPGKPDCTPEEFALWHSYPARAHPLVWQHRSGRKSFVLSTSGAYVEDMHKVESRELLERLMRHATRPDHVYRHRWRMGDMVMWDNTGTVHRVRPFAAESGRELHRFTLNGEEPVRQAA